MKGVEVQVHQVGKYLEVQIFFRLERWAVFSVEELEVCLEMELVSPTMNVNPKVEPKLAHVLLGKK